MDIENIILESYVKNYELTPSAQRPICLLPLNFYLTLVNRKGRLYYYLLPFTY